MDTSNLENGDLLFMRDNSEFSKAIIETTKEYSHVGIFFDGMIYHASRKYGVTKQKLAGFLSEGNWNVDVYRYPEIDCEIVREQAEKYLGREYNHSFYPGNDKFYCSQYIAEILPIFDWVPMKFNDDVNEVSDYWKKYYDELGLDVPVGVPGTNPSQISKCKKIKLIGKLKQNMKNSQ
ncbi:MAG: UDP-N-acetylmuramoylalanyl-D-glutamate--2,6-diaminopimelate ligase [Treponema sp.]|nr:UDP-N-acetylmuramoylalanyl-D-glutamate--2,6-diaminopimelate ligase [Treponema sp.]